jgi:hypothetical protein
MWSQFKDMADSKDRQLRERVLKQAELEAQKKRDERSAAVVAPAGAPAPKPGEPASAQLPPSSALEANELATRYLLAKDMDELGYGSNLALLSKLKADNPKP